MATMLHHSPMSHIISRHSCLNNMDSVTWECVHDESSRDIHMGTLQEHINMGFPETAYHIPIQLQQYWQHRDQLSVVDGIMMYNNRIIIMPNLCPEGMNNHARQCMFWPGIMSDIQRTQDHCTTCQMVAPSQTHLPPAEPMVPSVPFQSIVMDY